MTEEVKKKFVPKRRAPYLLQDEVVNKNVVVARKYKNKIVKNTTTSLSSGVKSEQTTKQVNSINNYDAISKLYGIQKKIILFFVKDCINRNSTETGAITLDSLCHISSTTKKTLKKTIQRLVEKNIIKRVGGKRGKGGFSVFALKKEFIDIAKIKLDMEKEIINNSQNNSFISVKKTNELPEEWSNINYSSIESIGFSASHLRQLYNSKVTTADIVKNSIEHFAFALENNPDKFKKYKSEISALMSTLTRGGIWLEPQYESPIDRSLRLKLEQTKAEQQKRDEMKSELIDVEFKSWVSSINMDEKNKIMPEDIKNSRFEAEKESFLKQYFKDNHWLNIQQEKYSDYF